MVTLQSLQFCSLSVKLREERVLFVADWLIAFDLFLGVVLFVDVSLLARVRARKDQGHAGLPAVDFRRH